MSTRLKVLISAYACSPYRGSEPGMGWNFVAGLSRHHEIHVIAEKKKWERPVNEYLDDHPVLKKNLSFYFIEKKRNKPLRKIWPPSYYWYYKDWQKKAYQLALKLHQKENFDLIHQLNMVGYREPGYLWKIDKPFVWGPIGGMENSPWRFLPSLGFKGLIFYTGRNIYNTIQRRWLTRPQKAAEIRNSRLIAATPSNQKLIKKMWGKDSDVICEVGEEAKLSNGSLNERKANQPLKIIWSGQHTYRKNLPLLLHSIQEISFPYEVHILGEGKMTARWKKIAQELAVSKKCFWHGWVEREEALSIMKSGHVLCITSISDLTSTVTLEALSCGLPVLCLDHCGFSHVINDECGIKIPVSSPKEASAAFTKGVEKLYKNESYRQELAIGALIRAKDFSWDKKIDKLNSIYQSLLNEVNE